MTTITTIADELGALANKETPDEARNKRAAEVMLAQAESFKVATQDDYTMATDQLRQVMERWKAMEADRVTFTGPMNTVLDRLNSRFQPHLKTLKQVEGIIKGKMAGFLTEQERIASAARAEADRIAAVERKRLDDEAAAVRRKADEEAAAARRAEEQRAAAARAEAARLEAEATAARGKKAKAEAEERARVQREANERAAAEEAERTRIANEEAERRAQALERESAITIAQPVVVAVQKGRGISTPKTFDFEVTNPLDLMKFIVEKRPDLVVLFDTNDKNLRRHVLMMGAGTDLPGVRVFEKTSITVR